MSVQNSIVVVNHNAGSALMKMLSALRMEEAITCEVIVVDVASRDESASHAKMRFPSIRVRETRHNRGWAEAANRGLRDALGEVVVVCHADIVASIHDLIELADRVREGAVRRLAVMLPTLVDSHGHPLPFVGRLPGLASSTIGLFSPAGVRKLSLPSLEHVADHEWAILPCAAFNATVLDKMGSFDERFLRYYADADVCLRVHERSYRIGISRDIRVMHLPEKAEPGEDDLQLMRADHERYIAKHRPAWERGLVSVYEKLKKKKAG
jgi:N-acetylglucosaminyl-diphospho-decaprenol L-rhamnosyltransferase